LWGAAEPANVDDRRTSGTAAVARGAHVFGREQGGVSAASSDLDLTLDDLEIAVDAVAVPQGITLPLTLLTSRQAQPRPISSDFYRGWQSADRRAFESYESGRSELFSVGIHVLEQHTALMRAIEARIQSYQDFLTSAPLSSGISRPV